MAGKRVQKSVEQDSRYHDTWRLLKKYRDVVWSMELSVQQLKKEFECEYGSTIDDFLESVYMAGADLSGTQIENQAGFIEGSLKMISLVDSAVDVLRTKHKTARRTIGFCTTPISRRNRLKTSMLLLSSFNRTSGTSAERPITVNVKRR